MMWCTYCRKPSDWDITGMPQTLPLIPAPALIPAFLPASCPNTGVPCFTAPHFTALHRCGLFFFLIERQDLPRAKRLQLTVQQYLLYCSGPKPNPQHWGVLVIFQPEQLCNSGCRHTFYGLTSRAGTHLREFISDSENQDPVGYFTV